MSQNIKNTNLHFNLDKELQKKAWTYLQSMDKSTFKSYSHVISLALVGYFDRYYRLVDDPYLETREREEQFVNQIVDGVQDSIKKSLPVFLAGCFATLTQLPKNSLEESQRDIQAK